MTTEDFITSINGDPAEYDLDAITEELDREGIDLDTFDGSGQDLHDYPSGTTEKVWAILDKHSL